MDFPKSIHLHLYFPRNVLVSPPLLTNWLQATTSGTTTTSTYVLQLRSPVLALYCIFSPDLLIFLSVFKTYFTRSSKPIILILMRLFLVASIQVQALLNIQQNLGSPFTSCQGPSFSTPPSNAQNLKFKCTAKIHSYTLYTMYTQLMFKCPPNFQPSESFQCNSRVHCLSTKGLGTFISLQKSQEPH